MKEVVLESRVAGKRGAGQKAAMWVWAIVRTIILVGISFYILYPLLLKLSLAFMDKSDLYDATVNLIPRHFTFDNIKLVMQAMDFWWSFLGSFICVVVATVTQLLACTLIGYGLARFKFPGRGLLFGLVVFTLVVPPVTIVICNYLNLVYFDIFGIFKALGWQINLTSGTFDFGGYKLNLNMVPWALIVNGLTGVAYKNGIYIYIVRQYFRNVPKELEEAAYIDGAGHFRTFRQIMLPSATPILLVVAIFTAVWQWTDVMHSAWFAQGTPNLAIALDRLTETVRSIMGPDSTGALPTIDEGYRKLLNSTGILMLITPLILFYAFAQKYFVEGIERSGIVG